MAEKTHFGQSRTSAITRTPSIRIEVIRWDWSSGAPKDQKPLDITHAVIAYRWAKNNSNPDSNAELTLIPQQRDIHYLDSFNPMDVVKIYEFDVLKYQGFMRRIAASGQIDRSGKPIRTVQITCSSFGALLSEGQLGLNYFLKIGTTYDVSNAIKNFAAKLADIINDASSTYATMVKAIVEQWLAFLEINGASIYKKYFTTFINYTDGMMGKTCPGVPKDFFLFNTSEQTVSLWDTIQKVIQSPFNECFLDCGPRKVWVENSPTLSPSKPGEITLGNEVDYLIIRTPPFNGTVIDGNKVDLWDSLPSRTIPLSYLTRFDLNKTMDESYSFYMVSPSVYNPGQYALIANGRYAQDDVAFNKYLYRPVMMDTFFTRIQKPESSDLDAKADNIYKDSQDKAETLKNWNEKNDQYLSGSISIMVPSDDSFDPRVGEKIELEGISDAYFYVEGISHNWSYGSALISDVALSRGYGMKAPIELKDKIFRRGLFAMGAAFI